MLSDTTRIILLIVIITICLVYHILYMGKKNPSEPFTKLRAMVYSILIPIPIFYIPSIFTALNRIPKDCPANKSMTVICDGVTYIDWFYIQNMIGLCYPLMTLLVWYWFDFKYLKWKGVGSYRSRQASNLLIIILSFLMLLPLLYIRNFLLGG